MGTNTTDKPKFDLITASRSKKYRIITAVVLIFGLLFMGLGLLLRGFVTGTVTPNDLQISELSGLNHGNYRCNISTDQSFILRTGTAMDQALSTPITFKIYDGAEQFLEIQDINHNTITQAYYPGMFYLHIRPNSPEFTNTNDRPEGKLLISCGSYYKEITFTYYKV